MMFSKKHSPPALPALCQGLEHTLRANPSPLQDSIWDLPALGMRFPPVPANTRSDSPAVLFSCPSVPARAVLELPSSGTTALAPGSACCPPRSLANAIVVPCSGNSSRCSHCCVSQSPASPCCAQAVALVPSGPVLSSISSPCLSQAPLPLSEAQPSLPQLEAPVQLPGFCCNTHSNLSSFQSFNLQQLPPEGWGVQFLCQYLCPSRRFQELQLSLTSVQCSIKWTVYGNKFKMFTILYILYI